MHSNRAIPHTQSIGVHQIAVAKKMEDGTIMVREPVGEPMAGYYRCIIEPGVFHTAEEQLRANRGTGGSKSAGAGRAGRWIG
jgi:hypothetical protein